MLRELIARISAAFKSPHPTDAHVAGVAQAVIDTLPPKCELHAEFHDDKVRFQAIDANGVKSEWSGWFTWEGEPIKLNWNTFWIEDRWTS